MTSASPSSAVQGGRVRGGHPVRRGPMAWSWLVAHRYSIPARAASALAPTSGRHEVLRGEGGREGGQEERPRRRGALAPASPTRRISSACPCAWACSTPTRQDLIVYVLHPSFPGSRRPTTRTSSSLEPGGGWTRNP
ncbi:MAG: hypothetical protein R3F43_01030 [bacterium]